MLADLFAAAFRLFLCLKGRMNSPISHGYNFLSSTTQSTSVEATIRKTLFNSPPSLPSSPAPQSLPVLVSEHTPLSKNYRLHRQPKFDISLSSTQMQSLLRPEAAKPRRQQQPPLPTISTPSSSSSEQREVPEQQPRQRHGCVSKYNVGIPPQKCFVSS